MKQKPINAGRTLQLYLMSIIPLALVALFCYAPMFGIIIAFKKYTFSEGIFGSKWIGLKNFTFFLKSNDFLKVTWNTLSLNFLFIITGTAAAVILALLIYELKIRAAVKIYQTVFITPHFLSWVVVSFMAYTMLQPQYGIINGFLRRFGIEGPNWYTTPSAWPFILSIASVWKTVGMDCIMYYASLAGMDLAYTEAAKIDGAGKWQITWHIVIPHLFSIISIMTILKIGGIFRADFGLFYQLTMDAPQLYSVTDVVDTYIYRTMRMGDSYGVSTAIGMLQSVVGLVMVVLTNYFSKKAGGDEAALF
jgi:putative aldouronate transport system permease protein